MRGADAVIGALKQEGVKFISGVPGGSVHELIDALSYTPEIKPILCRHERVAVDIADGYSRVSGEPGVAMVVKGPGAANAFAGIANSYADSVPVLLLQGQVPHSDMGNQVTQEMELLDVYRTVSKWASTIVQIERIPEIMRKAFVQLRSGRPRPVVVEIPMNISSGEADPALLEYKTVPKHIRSGGDSSEIERAAEVLIGAKSPYLLAGAGVLFASATKELRRLAELLTLPVGTTLAGKSAFPENHPLALGLGGIPKGHYSTRQAIRFSKKADVYLTIGNSFKPQSTGGKSLGLTASGSMSLRLGTKLIHIDADPSELGKIYQPDIGIVGDAKLILQGLIDAVEDRIPPSRRESREDVIEEIREQKAEWLAEWKPIVTSEETPINPYRLTWDVMQTVDRAKTTVLHDSGDSRGYLSHLWEALEPRSFLGFGGQSAMGWSMGAAMGAKLARPDNLVINFIGDGAFGMTGMDIETAVRCGVPTLTIVVNNGAMDMSSQTQEKNFDGRSTKTWTHVSGKYWMIGEALGAYSQRVEKPSDIRPAVERAVRSTQTGRAALLEVMVRPLVAHPRLGEEGELNYTGFRGGKR